MRTQEMTRPIEDMNASQLRGEAHETIETIIAAVTHDIEMTESDKKALASATATGSVLLEGDPGTGKTLAAKTLARAIGGTYKRVQGAPDNQQSDILGYEWFHQGSGEMQFRPGPGLLANILLADELNRNTEKTQSAFLELMGEKQVTIGGETYYAQDPFTIIATQNPLEEFGTNPLPRAELDRFAASIKMEQTEQDEEKIMQRYLRSGELNDNVVSLTAVRGLRLAVKKVEVPANMNSMVLAIKNGVVNHEATNKDTSILNGRAKLSMLDLARFHALTRTGAANVQPEDVIFAAQYVLPHRIEVDFDKKEEHLEAIEKAKQAGEKTKLTEDPTMNIVHDVLRQVA